MIPPALTDVDHRFGVGVVVLAADDVGERDAVVAGVKVAGSLQRCYNGIARDGGWQTYDPHNG